MRWILLLQMASACAGRALLEPALYADEPPRMHADGVLASAQAEAWDGNPEQLDVVTPMLVTLVNQGPHHIQIRYEDMALVTEDGRQYPAISPFDIRGTAVERLDNTDWRSDTFTMAPWEAPVLTPYDDGPLGAPYPWDTVTLSVDLPTGDMIAKALHDEVLAPGDRRIGFVYFENLDADVASVDLTIDLHEVDTNEQVGTIVIPFEVHVPGKREQRQAEPVAVVPR